MPASLAHFLISNCPGPHIARLTNILSKSSLKKIFFKGYSIRQSDAATRL